MGWLTNLFLSWATRKQMEECAQFTTRLKSLDGSEIGLIVANATDRRHKLEAEFGWPLMQPSLTMTREPNATVQIGALIRMAQDTRDFISATALMVWLHTLRASVNPDLRQGGRDLWRQLERGFPHCINAMDGYKALTGVSLDVLDYQLFPAGFTPDPL